MKGLSAFGAFMIVFFSVSAQKFRCPVFGPAGMEMKMNFGVVIQQKNVVLAMIGTAKTDSLRFKRLDTGDSKDIRYNDGIQNFTMIIEEKSGIIKDVNYTHTLTATPEDKNMKPQVYYCTKS